MAYQDFYFISLESRPDIVGKVTDEQTLWSQIDLRSDEETAHLRERVEELLLLIPETEHKIFDMYRRGVNEARIAEHFGCSQAAVSYRLSRAVKRLKWWAGRPTKPVGFYDAVYQALDHCHGQRQLPCVRTVAVEVAVDNASIVLGLETARAMPISRSAHKSLNHAAVRHWVVEAERRLGAGAHANYINYSVNSWGMVHETRHTRSDIMPGSLSRNSRGKL